MVISKGNFVHKKSKTWHQISEMFFCDEKVKIPFFGSVIKHYQYAPNWSGKIIREPFIYVFWLIWDVWKSNFRSKVCI